MSSQKLGGKGKVLSHSEQSCPRLLRHTRSLCNWHWALKSPAWLSHIISQLSLTMAWASTKACRIWPSAASPNSSPATSCGQSNRSHCRLLLVPWTQLGKTAFAHALPSAWIFGSCPPPPPHQMKAYSSHGSGTSEISSKKAFLTLHSSSLLSWLPFDAQV